MGRLSNLMTRISLKDLGEGFDDGTFMRFRTFKDYSESSQFIDRLGESAEVNIPIFKDTLKHLFTGGTIFFEGEHVDAEAEDIDDLPDMVVTAMFNKVTKSDFLPPRIG